MLRKANDPRAWGTVVGYANGPAKETATIRDILRHGIRIRPRAQLSEDDWRELTLHYLDFSISNWGSLNHYVFNGSVTRHPEAREIVRQRAPLSDEIIASYRRMVDQVVLDLAAELGESCEAPT